MKTWLVWEMDYPDEGSSAFTTWTEKGAARAFRKATQTRGGIFGMPELDISEATPEVLAMREQEAK